MKYRKKPVIIDAEQYSIFKPTSKFIVDAVCGLAHNGFQGEFHIHTLEGIHNVQQGDWIIKGVKGEFYPCKPDIFEITYEPVKDSK